jgi:hypothetical protein
MGTVVKLHLAQRIGRDAAAIYHVAIMPCYDKKLEASRADFDVPGAARPLDASAATDVCCHAYLQRRGARAGCHASRRWPLCMRSRPSKVVLGRGGCRRGSLAGCSPLLLRLVPELSEL